MTIFLLAHAPWIKLALMIVLLAGLAAAQRLAPRRGDAGWARWRVNLGMIAVATLVTRLLLPISAAAVAVWAQTHGVGLFNRLAWPPMLAFGVSLMWEKSWREISVGDITQRNGVNSHFYFIGRINRVGPFVI